MPTIIPAIIPKDYEELKNNIALVRGIVPVVQIDICDGVFAPNITWPFNTLNKEGSILKAELDSHFTNIMNENDIEFLKDKVNVIITIVKVNDKLRNKFVFYLL